jgi:hypothetical protein
VFCPKQAARYKERYNDCMKELQPELNAEDKDIMGKLLPAGQIKYKYAARPQTVLQRANGKGTGEIFGFLGIPPSTVSLHINRYSRYGIDPLPRDKTRKGRRMRHAGVPGQ